MTSSFSGFFKVLAGFAPFRGKAALGAGLKGVMGTCYTEGPGNSPLFGSLLLGIGWISPIPKPGKIQRPIRVDGKRQQMALPQFATQMAHLVELSCSLNPLPYHLHSQRVAKMNHRLQH